MGLSSDEFWGLTYQEFFALQDLQEKQERRWDLRFGVIAATYVNCRLKQGTEPIRPEAFFRSVEEMEEQGEEMTPEETAAHLTQFFSQFRNQREKVGKISREKI